MKGFIASIFFISGMYDMYVNDCRGDGCLAGDDAPARLSLQIAATEFQSDFIGSEVMLGYDLPRTYGPFQPTIGLSMTDMGDYWVGLGAKWTVDDAATGPFFFETAFIPGYYQHRDGPDLGGHIQYRASVGVGYAFENGSSVLLAYDHRSNANTIFPNPGLETLSIRYAIEF